MKILVVGGGGREHALVWKIQQSPKVSQVYCMPGNPGMKGVIAVPSMPLESLADFAEKEGIELTMVGPEQPLCDGIVDIFRTRGLAVVGPDRRGAQLEGSKSFAKEFMEKYGIPTAKAAVFTTQAEADAYVRQEGAPIVIKADGLAAGKGVIVAMTEQEALDGVAMCFEGTFGNAGATVVVEECLMGEEASILALTDGVSVLPLASSQDHKRRDAGDLGPNTGGMGAYSPAPVVTEELWAEINDRVLTPFVKGCQEEGFDYRGVIYAGIMVTESGPKVLEFNVRFGDPETQAVLARLDSDLVDILEKTVEKRLSEAEMTWSDQAAVCVVMASGGYPGPIEKGFSINGIDAAESAGSVVFHAGTSRSAEGELINVGGRVLGVTALGVSIRDAVDNVYRGVRCISWPGAYYREDIAHRAFDR